jgi:hypothetical protein
MRKANKGLSSNAVTTTPSQGDNLATSAAAIA